MMTRAKELLFILSLLGVNALVLTQGTGVIYEAFSWKAFALVYEDTGNGPFTGDPVADPDGDSLKGGQHDPGINFDIFNPTGCLYNEATGVIVAGGSVTTSGTTNLNKGGDPMNGSLGCYAFEYTVRMPGTFTLTITPPTDCVVSTTCPDQGLLTTSTLGGVDQPPFSIGNFPDAALTMVPAACTDWYSQILPDRLDKDGDPRAVINNNIALDCSGRCGNSVINTEVGEQCDDGNGLSGDGCDEDCLGPEDGFTCPGSPGACSPICGDSMVVMGETCDDGNTNPGDGCDGSCMTEDGFVCPSSGGACSPDCGDGMIVVGETCDDGNTTPGDGCDDTCMGPETGFTCPTPGSPCVPICGDGMVLGNETCDDGNTTPGDGCDDTCMGPETGFTCPTPGSPCVPICGDGMVLGSETCDDGNTTAGDGCDDSCMGPEPGFTCPTPGTPCEPICGDGMVVLGEVCDDGNLSNQDGCLNDCSLATCGDGFVCSDAATCTSGPDDGVEGCDDGDNFADTFCTADCALQVTPSPALDRNAIAVATLTLLLLGAFSMRRLRTSGQHASRRKLHR